MIILSVSRAFSHFDDLVIFLSYCRFRGYNGHLRSFGDVLIILEFLVIFGNCGHFKDILVFWAF